MKKNYLDDFRGAIKGIATLQRKIAGLKTRIASLESRTAALITLADLNGLGDHFITVKAAEEIGWVRMTPEQRTQLADQLKALHGDPHAP